MPAAPLAPAGDRPGFAAGLVADVKVVLPAWLAARALVALAFVLAGAVAEWAAGPGHQSFQRNLGLGAWDSGWYQDIATRGYGALDAEALRFFPLHPLLGRVLGVVFLGHADIAVVVLANVLALLAAVLLRRLVLTETDDVALADRSAWALALFPPSFVLAWGYAEPLFLVLSVGAFLAVRRGRHDLAALCGLGAALTRPLGVLLAVPMAVEVARSWRALDRRGRLTGAAAVLSPLVGLAAYIAWVARTFGDASLPFSVQNQYRQTVDPITSLVRALGDLFGPERFADGLHLPFALAFVGLAVVVGRRWPASYTAYTVVVLVAALSAGNLNSLERYGLNAFPLVLALASITTTQRRERLALAVCANGLLALAALAWLGIYVP